jgi:hypothetical protein
MSNEINAYCGYGMGDSIINFVFFYQIKDYIESNNIKINYHCPEKHHNNLKQFNCSKNINILPYDVNGYELWQGTQNLYSGKYIEDILCDMFNDFLKQNNIPIIVEKFEYQDNDLLIRYDKIDSKYKDLDLLIINSIPNSGQFNYDKSEFDNFIIDLSKKYKVATTLYVDENILSLDEFCVKDIAALATHARKIIAINTGPSIALYNTDILNNTESIYLLDNCSYKFKTRKIIEARQISDLAFLLNNSSENFDPNKNYYYSFQYKLLLLLLLLLFLIIFIFCFYYKKVEIKRLLLHLFSFKTSILKSKK